MKVNDFFCGAGGMGLGFHEAGFAVAGAYDYDKYAVESYKHNLSDVVRQCDIRDLTHEDIPEANVWTFGFPCFVPGTLVLTDNGFKKIEDIEIGDMVLTHTNSYKKVVSPMINKANHLYRISTAASEDLRTTKEHPFYARKQKKMWGSSISVNEISISEPSWVKAMDLTEDHFVGMAINKESFIPEIDGTTYPNVSKIINTGEFWESIGRLLGKLSLSEKLTASHEMETYLSQFGDNPENLKITKDILNLPASLVKEFLFGYFKTAGVYAGNRFGVNSVSKELIYGLGHCIAKAFHMPYIVQYYPNAKKLTTLGKSMDLYSLTFYPNKTDLEESFYEDGYLWFPIKKIQTEAYNGPVYNFEVADDNSYVVQNIIVHNCQDISVAGKRKGMIKGETRSGMFYEIMRLLEEIELQGKKLPDIIMAENVKMVKELLPEIEKEYKERGYNMYYKLLNSKYWGVAQNRERYFIVGVHEKYLSPFIFPHEQTDFVPPLSQFLESEVDEKFFIDNEKALKVIEEARKRVEIKGVHPCITPDRLNKRQNGRRAKGNEEEMYTLTAQDIHGVIVDDTYGYDGIRFYDEVCPTLRASRSGLKTIDVVGRLDVKGQDNIRRVYDPEGVAPTLTTSEGGNRQPKIVLYENLDTHKSAVRKLTPREYARLQGFPDSYEQVVSNSQFYKQMGNAVTVNVSKALAERIKSFITNEESLERYMNYVLCYVDEDKAYFTGKKLEEQWGDDWNDVPYEHNAGEPYGEIGKDLLILEFKAGKCCSDIRYPHSGFDNSPYSVEKINKGMAPWLEFDVYNEDYSHTPCSIHAGISLVEFIDKMREHGGDIKLILEEE